jgi:hypothetical protein
MTPAGVRAGLRAPLHHARALRSAGEARIVIFALTARWDEARAAMP